MEALFWVCERSHNVFCQCLEIVDLLEATYLCLLTPCLQLHIRFHSNYFLKKYISVACDYDDIEKKKYYNQNIFNKYEAPFANIS